MTQATATKPSVITDAPIHPSLATSDLARAKAWYAEKLGWQPSFEMDGMLAYSVGDLSFSVYESEYAGTAKNTVMNWVVPDVRAEMTRLRGRGVAFEDYDMGEVKTEDGIMTDPSGGKSAWFKDADGNIVALISAGPDAPAAASDLGITTMIAAADMERAKRWYSEKLGFKPEYDMEGWLSGYRSGDSRFVVYQTEFAGTAKNTVAEWRLKGLTDEVARLRARGVAFEEYDMGEWGKTVDGIMSDPQGPFIAWFKDSEGNILSITEDRDPGPG